MLVPLLHHPTIMCEHRPDCHSLPKILEAAQPPSPFQVAQFENGVRFVLRSANCHNEPGSPCADLVDLPCMDDLEQHSIPYRPLSLRSAHRLCGMIHQALAGRPENGVTVGPFRTMMDMTNGAQILKTVLSKGSSALET